MEATERSVLIVDDNDDIRANIKDILDDLGYRTDTAADGPSALRLVRERSYDVALVDFKMPEMDGATLYREIKKIRPELVAIMITAYAGSDGVQQARDAGTWKVLRKPVDFTQLLPMIEEAVREPVVLVVDDDEEFCDNLWQLLRERGYRVNVAHSEQEAMEKTTDPKFQVALIDLHLGSGNGCNVFRRLHEQRPEVRTILITGFRSEVEALGEDLTRDGLDAVCYKPIDIPQLLDTLGRFQKVSDV